MIACRCTRYYAVAVLAMAFCVSGLGAETNPFGVTNPFEIGGTGGGGGVAKFFGSTAERDAYFQTNDKELRNGVTAAIGDPAVIYMWNGTAWVEAANTFIGAKGDTGSQGIQGIPGNDGEDGEAATLTIGTVNTLAPTEAATVENIGSDTNAVLVLGIPQGMRGQQGERGLTGEAAVANVRYRGEWVSTDEYLLNDIAVGADGSAYVALATSTGIEPSTDTTGAWALFVSQGPQGEIGPEGPQGQVGLTGPQGIAGSISIYSDQGVDWGSLARTALAGTIYLPSESDGTTMAYGEPFVVPYDGYISVMLQFRGAARGYKNIQITVNSVSRVMREIGDDSSLTGSESYFGQLVYLIPVNKDDSVVFGVDIRTSGTIPWNDSYCYLEMYKRNGASIVEDAVATAFNSHVNDTNIHLSTTDRASLDQLESGGGGTGTETDPIYTADKAGNMQLGDVEIAGSLTLGQPPLSPAEATNKAYVDSAIGSATQDVADNYAVKPDSRSGYVMPPQVFDYADSNTFTVDAAPKFVLEAMVLRPDSFTYMQQSDISFSGTSVTLNNVTINSGDKVKITYAIQ